MMTCIFKMCSEVLCVGILGMQFGYKAEKINKQTYNKKLQKMPGRQKKKKMKLQRLYRSEKLDKVNHESGRRIGE